MSSIKNFFKKTIGDTKEVTWSDLDHKKVYGAGGVVVALALIVGITIGNGIGKKSAGTQSPSSTGITQTSVNTTADATQVANDPLEVNAYPQINELVTRYYTDYADGNVDDIAQIVDTLTDEEKASITSRSQYIEEYQNIICYTKRGMEEGSYVAFVASEMKIINQATPAPGMKTLYICLEDDGSYRISSYDTEERQAYVETLWAGEDVKVIFAEIETRFNQILSSDEELASFYGKIQEVAGNSVSDVNGEAEPTDVAEAEAEDTQANEEETTTPEETATPEETTTPEETGEKPTEEATTTSTESSKKRVLEAIKIRSERSTDSEILKTLFGGATVTVTETYSDGWCKINYEGTVGYCKSEYLD